MPATRRLLTALACVLALAFGALVPGRAAETLDRIVAVVNDSVILASELDTQIALTRDRLQRSDQGMPPDDVLRQRVLEQLVMEKIQLERAEAAGIDVDDEAVNNAMRNVARRNDTDLAGLRRDVQQDGLDFERLRGDIRHQLIISRLRQREVASQVQVSEQEVDDALQQMEEANQERSEYKLQHILIELPAEATSEQVTNARTRAEALIKRLRGGADFAQLATRVSDGPKALDGGALGWRPATSLPSLFVDAVSGMQEGDISKPLRSPNGFHILRLQDRRGGVPQTVTERHVRHILLRPDESTEPGSATSSSTTEVTPDSRNSDEDATNPEARTPRERLVALRRRIKAGADFATLARANSDDQESARKGGDLGWVGPGEMTPAFQDVIDDMEPGTLSEPFRTPYGWHLVEVLGQRQREDVEQYRRARIRQAIYRREIEQEAQRWRQRLRDQAYVEIRSDQD